jgi:hypothetical protein
MVRSVQEDRSRSPQRWIVTIVLKAKADERIIANKQKIDAAAKKVVPINQPSA